MPDATNQHEDVKEQARQLAKAVDELFQSQGHRPALSEWRQEFEREMEGWRQRLEGAERGKSKIGDFIEKYVPTPWDSEDPSLATQAMVLAFFHDTHYEKGAKLLGDLKDDSECMSAFRKAYRFEDSEAYMSVADVDNPPSPPRYGRNRLDVIETYLRSVRAHFDEKVSKPETARSAGEKRIWTKETCPNCGLPGVEFLSINAFRAHCSAADIRCYGWRKLKLLRDGGDYWMNAARELPWCANCKDKTPAGDGVVGRPDSPKAAGYNLTKGDKENIKTWATRALKDMYSDVDREAAEAFDPETIGLPGHKETVWDEAYQAAFTEMADQMQAESGSLQRDQALSIGDTAIKSVLTRKQEQQSASSDPKILEIADSSGHIVSEHRSKAQAAYKRERAQQEEEEEEKRLGHQRP